MWNANHIGLTTSRLGVGAGQLRLEHTLRTAQQVVTQLGCILLQSGLTESAIEARLVHFQAIAQDGSI